MSTAVAERAPSLFDTLVERAPERRDAIVGRAPEAPGAVVDRASELADAVAERAPSSFDAVGDEPTLDEVLSGVWEGLIAHRVEECPVCAGELVPDYAQHALPIGGHCVDCGSVLS